VRALQQRGYALRSGVNTGRRTFLSFVAKQANPGLERLADSLFDAGGRRSLTEKAADR
jgi:hypothetical protein